MKTCTKCLEEKEHTEFAIKGKSGSSWCKPCHNEYNKGHYQLTKHKYKEKRSQSNTTRRLKFKACTDAFKTEKGCQQCGWNKHPAGLDFHHTDNNKEYNVGSMNSKSLRLVKIEMEKCQVLCACCHRVLHAEERGA